MKNYVARMAGNIVQEIIVADYEWVMTNLDGQWQDLGGEPLTVAIGWIYDEDSDDFVAPPVEEPPLPA